MNSIDKRKLWLRWVAANGLGEMFGLGLTFVVGAEVISRLGNQQSSGVILISFSVAVASGVIEATLVGLVQWWAMHPWFPKITRGGWWLATLIGALLAYVMGYLPSTLMSLGEQASQSQASTAEPAQWLVLLLAAGLGAAGGAVLSFAQWLTMRRKIPGASIWIPANMLAWLVGMPLIFWGIDTSQKLGGLVWLILFIAGVLLLTGLVVGAIHGAFLVRLVKNGSSPA
jgi:magnesium-transporting ATPase (P-type)